MVLWPPGETNKTHRQRERKIAGGLEERKCEKSKR